MGWQLLAWLSALFPASQAVLLAWVFSVPLVPPAPEHPAPVPEPSPSQTPPSLLSGLKQVEQNGGCSWPLLTSRANCRKKLSCGTQCSNPQSLSSGPLPQQQNGLRTTDAKRDAKRMSAKEVTINVTDSIRQVDRSKRITKNCVN
uniref:Brain and acute leukemia cytoplasmic protein n=1 Tax=Oryctolagus cuniculus TaxID=9986 RepID=G1T5Z9_RABIT